MSVTIDIKRPSGVIETVDVSDKFVIMTDAIFAKIVDATVKAGRGTPIAYHNNSTYQMTAKDRELKDYCDHNDRVHKAMSN
jgi:hypothetical protein